MASQGLEMMRALDPHGFLQAFLSNAIRADGRLLHDFRSTTISHGIFNHNNTRGSSMVKIGATIISCGITVQVGIPIPHRPTDGDIKFEVALWPICSLKYDRLKSDEGCEMEALLTSLFNKGDILDLSQLQIIAGKFAFRLCIHITCISTAGNIRDASILAVVAALLDFTLPDDSFYTNINNSNININSSILNTLQLSPVRTNRKLTLNRIPVSVTLSLFEGHILVDPTAEELSVPHVLCTVIVDMKGVVERGSEENTRVLYFSQNCQNMNGVTQGVDSKTMRQILAIAKVQASVLWQQAADLMPNSISTSS